MNDEFKLAYRLRTELPPEASGRMWAEDLAFSLTRRQACLLIGSGFLFSLQAQQGEVRIGSRLLIGDDGAVTLLTGKVDMGQGSRTLLTQCVAEELRIAPERVRVVMGDTGSTPDDGGTWASATTPETVPVVRAAAATVRELLLKAGGLPGRSRLDKADLPGLAKKVRIDEAVRNDKALTAPADWKVLGDSVHAVRSRDIVTGGLKYASDLHVAGMQHAAVLRPDAYSARVKSAPEGVLRDGPTVAVVADSAEALRRSAKPAVEWEADPLPAREAYFRRLRETARDPDPNPKVKYPALFDVGAARSKVAAASWLHAALYECDPVAHVPLEIRAVLAHFGTDGKLTITAGTQAPFLVREDVARATGIPAANIRIIGTEIGGGYGGKQRGELEIEAARIARMRPGKTVRVAWTRRDEFERGYFRPAAIVEMKAALGGDGVIEGWEHHNYNSGASGLKPGYGFSDYWCGFHRSTESSLRQGSYRSLAAAANTFARESFIDECAHAASVEPLEYRLRHISDERLKQVALRAATTFGWGRAMKGQGVALNVEKNACLACMVRVEPGPNGQIRVAEAVVVGDFGAALNPANLQHQLEGGFLQSLGFALFERVEWSGERLVTNSLSRYRVPRFADVPERFQAILIDRRDVPSAGAGEAPVTIAAPAIANAWFALTGERRRCLPLLPGEG